MTNYRLLSRGVLMRRAVYGFVTVVKARRSQSRRCEAVDARYGVNGMDNNNVSRRRGDDNKHDRNQCGPNT